MMMVMVLVIMVMVVVMLMMMLLLLWLVTAGDDDDDDWMTVQSMIITHMCLLNSAVMTSRLCCDLTGSCLTWVSSVKLFVGAANRRCGPFL